MILLLGFLSSGPGLAQTTQPGESARAVAEAFFADVVAGQVEAARLRVLVLAEDDPWKVNDDMEEFLDAVGSGVLAKASFQVHDFKQEGDVGVGILELSHPGRKPDIETILLIRVDGRWLVTFVTPRDVKHTGLPDDVKRSSEALIPWADKRMSDFHRLMRKPGDKAQSKKNTALALAAFRGDIDAARKHLADGADINGDSVGLGSPLRAAAIHDQRDMVRWLVEQGAFLDLPWENVLLDSINHNKPEMALLLVTLGANGNRLDDNQTPLTLAAAHGMAEVVRAILDRGFKHDVHDSVRTTLLHFAASSGDWNTFEIVRPYYTDLTIRDQFGATALHAVCAGYIGSKGRDHARIARVLLDAGVDPHAKANNAIAKDINNGSAIAFAALGLVKTGTVPVLLERVKYQPEDLADPVWLASKWAAVEDLRALIEHGAPKDVSGALHRAVYVRSIEKVRLLVDHGAPINAVYGKLERTPLQDAVAFSTPEIVQFLLDRGADRTIRDAEGMSAAALARVRQEKGRESNLKDEREYLPEFPNSADSGVRIFKLLTESAANDAT